MLLANAPKWIATVFGLPVIGGVISDIVLWAANWMISTGVLELKVKIINYMDDSARTKWAAQLPILQQLQASGGTMTPAELAAYDAALQAIAENHNGIVNF